MDQAAAKAVAAADAVHQMDEIIPGKEGFAADVKHAAPVVV